MKYSHYIAGEWVAGGSYSTNINPSDVSDVVGEYASGSAADVDAAVQSALRAFPAWSSSGVQTRANMLEVIAAEILARSAELGDLLSQLEGKTRREAIAEVTRAGQIFRFFAGECVRLAGQVLPSVRPGISVEVTREPMGVIGLITPWNFPIAIPAWKVAPALAYGNCVVLKPADLVPGSAWALADIVARARVPAGVFNLVMGQGRLVGEAIVQHPGIAAISFTGSQSIGRGIAIACAEQSKKVQLEMGGKNPQVVLDDADLQRAVELCVQSAFFSTGQRCTAASRLIVTDGIHDNFVGALAQRTVSLRVGDARHEATDIGPAVSGSQLAQDMNYVSIAKGEGARLLCGGERLERETEGFYFAPALLVDTIPGMRINNEEVFGPVASVIRVKDYEEALSVANDTPFGLTAGIATTSLKYATHFKRHAQAGMVMVNAPTAGVDYHVPFGGRKASSFGPREQGSYASEFFTTVKTSYIVDE